jgi:hypothetical protein
LLSDDEELYHKVFPSSKMSSSHSFGLVVGGKTSQKMDHFMKVLQHSEEENAHLRGIVSQLLSRSEKFEEN